MNRGLLHLIKCLISMVYCLVFAFIIAGMGFGLELGLFVGALVTFVLGVASFNSVGPMMPMMKGNSNGSSMDSEDLRRASEVTTLVNDAEQELPSGNMFTAINNKKGKVIQRTSLTGLELVKELVYRRSAMELILAGLLVGLITFAPYIHYFL